MEYLNYMKKIIKLFVKIKHLLNSLYYLKSIINKNVYPCRLIGEKIIHSNNDTIILYKIRGKENTNEISLKILLSNIRLVEKFSPIESVKLGVLSFKNTILSLPYHDRRKKFNAIKEIMFNSVHDICPSKKLNKSQLKYEITEHIDPSSKFLNEVATKNSYAYKLVHGKFCNENKDTIITYTILGKREGYEISLRNLLLNKNLLQKFHPTETVKFGFIFSGDQMS